MSRPWSPPPESYRRPPEPRRHSDTWRALGLVGVIVAVMGCVAHAFLSRGTDPSPAGLYVATLGAAIAALWLIARAFGN